MNNNILMLVRREIWEHRSLWISPLVVAGVLLVIAAFGGVHFSDSGNFWFGSGNHDSGLEHLSPAEREALLASVAPDETKRELIITGLFGGLMMVQLLALGVVVFFYLLDTLLAERRDRSILFWKSLPVSDGEVVASKTLTALVAAPAFVIVLNAVFLLLFSGVVALRLSDTPFSPWSAEIWLRSQAVMLAFVPMVVIWYLPLTGYLLLLSVWVRKNAFLWAVLPPLGILLIEGLITHTDYLGRFLQDRFVGFGFIMKLDEGPDFGPDELLNGAYTLIGRVFADYHIWVGALAGLALIYAAARIRRYRDDT